MTAQDERSNSVAKSSDSLGQIALFAVVWFCLLWLLIGILAVHAYRVGEASPFRYVGF